MPCPDCRIATVRVTDDLFAIRRGEDWIHNGTERHMARSDVLRDSNRVRFRSQSGAGKQGEQNNDSNSKTLCGHANQLITSDQRHSNSVPRLPQELFSSAVTFQNILYHIPSFNDCDFSLKFTYVPAVICLLL